MKDNKKTLSYTESIEIHKAKYKTDLEKVIASYKEKGYRDARILSDTITYLKGENALSIKINVEEGNKTILETSSFRKHCLFRSITE
jgi:outer membrane protein insertion porin family